MDTPSKPDTETSPGQKTRRAYRSIKNARVKAGGAAMPGLKAWARGVLGGHSREIVAKWFENKRAAR